VARSAHNDSAHDEAQRHLIRCGRTPTEPRVRREVATVTRNIQGGTALDVGNADICDSSAEHGCESRELPRSSS
jgi:hypothetical protein